MGNDDIPLQPGQAAASPSSEEGRRGRSGGSGWTWVLGLAAVSTTLGCALPAGYHIGVVNNPQAVIKEFLNTTITERYNVRMSEWQLSVVWSSVVSIFIVGGVIGSLCASSLADKLGRKGSILASDVVGIVGGVLFVVCAEVNSVELLLLGRLLVGISSGLTTAVVPMYLTELSPIHLRGATGVICPLGITIGVLVSQVMGLQLVLGTADGWHWLFALYVPLTFLSALAFPLLPESPKYLFVIRGLEDRAVKELERVRGGAGVSVSEEVELLKGERRRQQQAGAWSAMSVVRDRRLTLPLTLVIAMQAGQQLSGVNAVFYYSSAIFRGAGLSELHAQLGSLGAGVVNVAVAALSVYTMHRFPRRRIMLISCCGAVAALALLTLAITYNKSSVVLQYVPIGAVLLYVFVYGLGLGPLPYFVGSELFEVGPRPVAMAWGSMANWAGNFLVGMTFPALNDAIGQYVFIFYITAVVCLTYFLLMYFPETKGLDQGQVAVMLQDGFSSTISRRVRPASSSLTSRSLQ